MHLPVCREPCDDRKFGLVIDIAGAPNAGQDGVVAVMKAVHDKVAQGTGLRLGRLAWDALAEKDGSTSAP